jgi:hypothetical protein
MRRRIHYQPDRQPVTESGDNRMRIISAAVINNYNFKRQ